jgi:hypothetical protein
LGRFANVVLMMLPSLLVIVAVLEKQLANLKEAA